MTAEVTGRGPAAGPREEVPGRAGRLRAGDRLRRVPDGVTALAVGAVAAVLAAVPQWRGSFFYYVHVGDGFDQYLPLWHLFGRQLRAGHWFPMDPAGWVGGNYAAEGIDGIWNPVNLANYVLVSTFDDLSRAAFVVVAELLGVLAAGVFLLAREYGAARVPAVVVGIAAPFAGFTLWYEAGGWYMGLAAFAWTAHFWWSARRSARGALVPLVPFLFGALAITTGNPYAAVGVLVVLLAVGTELVVTRRFRRLVQLAVTGACVGAVALPVFLPLLGAGAVTDRQNTAALANDTSLVPGLGDLLAGSSVTYLPRITSWFGALDPFPAAYVAWFLAPLLPWLRWRAGLARLGRGAVGVWVVLGVYLAASLAPSQVWLFRWPLRMTEYLWLAVLVVFAVLLSAGPAPGSVRRRAVLSGGVLLAGAYLAWAVRPERLLAVHLGGLALSAGLVGLAVWGWWRRGAAVLGAVLLAGTAGVLALQAGAFPPTAPGAVPVEPGWSVARMRAGAATYQGTVLQLATPTGVTGAQLQAGVLAFGNVPRALGTDAVTSYSGMGFVDFQRTLCADYNSTFCPQSFDRVWAPAGEGVDVPLVDALRISTLVVQNSLRPDVAGRTPPAGWHVALRDDVRTVWVRDRPLAGPGRVSWTSPGVAAVGGRSTPERETVRYRARTAGTVLFARLAWPGYSATVDGRPVPVRAGPAGLLRAEVPEGEHTLAVSYRAPGLRAGALVAAGAAVVVLVQSGLYLRSARRRARTGSPLRPGAPAT